MIVETAASSLMVRVSIIKKFKSTFRFLTIIELEPTLRAILLFYCYHVPLLLVH